MQVHLHLSEARVSTWAISPIGAQVYTWASEIASTWAIPVIGAQVYTWASEIIFAWAIPVVGTQG